jgi:hypothetical protein
MRTKRPISARQLAANRRNAQKSTGPRTPAGRETVSLNAVKHGLCGNFGLLPGEDAIAYAARCRALIAELAPATPTEFNLAQTIANDLWRLDRASAIEINMFALGRIEDDSDPDHDPDMQQALAGARTFMNHTGKFALLSLYEQRLNRSVHKSFVELRRLQAERAKAIVSKPTLIRDLQAENAPNGFERANNISGGESVRQAA